MTLSVDSSSKAVIISILGTVAVVCFCIWRGRKVVQIDWKDDEDNPANWYLRDPNKFKRE